MKWWLVTFRLWRCFFNPSLSSLRNNTTWKHTKHSCMPYMIYIIYFSLITWSSILLAAQRRARASPLSIRGQFLIAGITSATTNHLKGTIVNYSQKKTVVDTKPTIIAAVNIKMIYHNQHCSKSWLPGQPEPFLPQLEAPAGKCRGGEGGDRTGQRSRQASCSTLRWSPAIISGDHWYCW